jgi:hypothetical protein
MQKTAAYHTWVEWSAEDSVCVGTCPDLISGIDGADPVRITLIDRDVPGFVQRERDYLQRSEIRSRPGFLRCA